MFYLPPLKSSKTVYRRILCLLSAGYRRVIGGLSAGSPVCRRVIGDLSAATASARVKRTCTPSPRWETSTGTPRSSQTHLIRRSPVPYVSMSAKQGIAAYKRSTTARAAGTLRKRPGLTSPYICSTVPSLPINATSIEHPMKKVCTEAQRGKTITIFACRIPPPALRTHRMRHEAPMRPKARCQNPVATTTRSACHPSSSRPRAIAAISAARNHITTPGRQGSSTVSRTCLSASGEPMFTPAMDSAPGQGVYDIVQR